MKVWVSISKNPKRFLSVKELDGVIWKNEMWSGRNFLFSDISNEIESIYLDHEFDDCRANGETILQNISIGISDVKKFKNLKKIFLIDFDKRIARKYEKCFENEGVKIINFNNK